MQLLTNIALLVGVLTIIVSWFVAVRLITGDKTAGTVTGQDTLRPQDLVGATSR